MNSRIHSLFSVIGVVALGFYIFQFEKLKKEAHLGLAHSLEIELERSRQIQFFSNLLKGRLTKDELLSALKSQGQEGQFSEKPEAHRIEVVTKPNWLKTSSTTLSEPGKLSFDFDDQGRLNAITTPPLTDHP